MVLLNDRDFVIYDSDTHETRLNRIALALQTLPKFVHVVDIDDLGEIKSEENIKAHTIFDEDIENTNDFTTFYKNVEHKYPNITFDIMIYIWLQRLIKTHGEIDTDTFEFLKIEIEGTFSNKGFFDPQTILRNPEFDFKEDIDKFIQEQTIVEENMNKLNLNIIPVPMDDLKPVKITFKVVITLYSDLVEVFDKIKVSPYLPYANHGNERHKIYKEFKNNIENWSYGHEDFIQFFIVNTEFLPNKFNEKYYSQCVMTLSETPNEAIMDIETVIDSGLNINSIIDRILKFMNIGNNIKSITKHNMNSVMNIPKQSFNKYILSDLITIDPTINSLCFIDESINVGRKRDNVSFFYKPIQSTNKIHILIKQTISDNKQSYKNGELYPLGSKYLQVHINKVETEQLVNDISLFVRKLISIYNSKEEEIANEYRKFIPNFAQNDDNKGGNKVVKSVVKSAKLKDIVPEIFAVNYARYVCNNPPVIVDDLIDTSNVKNFMVENVSQEYNQALLFPKEGPNQHWYACPNNTFIGLKQNTLSNKNEYPYLPCCYKTDQRDKMNYKNYYLGYNISKHTKDNEYIKTTSKFLNENEKGTIPANLENLFGTFILGRLKFYRLGVSSSPSSFFYCMNKAMEKKHPKNAIKSDYFVLCKQNAYDISVNELIRNYNDDNFYLDPSVYYRALEEFFGCYIYVFTRDPDNNGIIVHPKYKHFLVKYENDINKPIVMLFEHTGSESDNATIPRCELIFAENEQKDKIFTFTGPIAKNIESIFSTVLNWELGPYKSKNIPTNMIFKNIESQSFDSFGKVRVITVKFKNTKVIMITDPLPPMKIKESIGYTNNISEDIINKFIEAYNMKIINKTMGMYITEYNGMTYRFPYEISRESFLVDYSKKQRIARYLQEYIYFMYSIYIHNKNIEPDSKYINDFLRENTIVIPDYDYPSIPRKFYLQGPYLKNGKLIVPSLETAQRLGYSLDMMIKRNRNKIINYLNNELIQEYYLDKNDYTSSQDAIIFMNATALQNWIEEKEQNFTVQTIPSSDLNMFYLKLLDKTCLIQVCDSFKSAVGVAENWVKHGYNYPNSPISHSTNYTCYIFETPKNVTQYGNGEYNIIAWKENDIPKYGAILI